MKGYKLSYFQFSLFEIQFEEVKRRVEEVFPFQFSLFEIPEENLYYVTLKVRSFQFSLFEIQRPSNPDRGGNR